jgi:hypothetical protein
MKQVPACPFQTQEKTTQQLPQAERRVAGSATNRLMIAADQTNSEIMW